MCLMLYLASSIEVPLRTSPELSVENVEPSRESVRQWFSLPIVRFVGAHTGCSCGFPSVIAEAPVEYFDGIFAEGGDRERDLQSVRALLELVREHALVSGRVELYPVADGDEALRPKGAIDVGLDALQPDTFFLNEQFLYRIVRDAD